MDLSEFVSLNYVLKAAKAYELGCLIWNQNVFRGHFEMHCALPLLTCLYMVLALCSGLLEYVYESIDRQNGDSW